MTAGILYGLTAATFQSLAYVFTRLFLSGNRAGSAGLLAMSHVIMGVVSVAVLPLVWPEQIAPFRAFARPLVICSVSYLVAQAALFHALSRTDASRVSPLLGLKILLVAAITILFMGGSLSAWQLVAVVLCVVAAFVLNASGGHIGWPAVGGVLLACLGYALSDIHVRAMVDAMDMANRFHAAVVAACVVYTITGLAGAALLLRAGPASAGEWVRALPFALSWLAAMVLLFAAFAEIGVVFGGIVQATRGVISILIGAALAKAGLLHLEQRVTRRVLVRRFGAAVLMCVSIAVFVLGRPAAGAAEGGAAAEWSWRGPRRDGKSDATGLLRAWPDGGPPLLWSVDGCGTGYAGVTLSGGCLYTAGTFEGRTFVLAFGMDGTPRWRAPNGEALAAAPRGTGWHGSRYDGARTAPVADGDRLYHLNATGRLAAYDATSGDELWAVSLPERFDAGIPFWGYSEHVLVDGPRLLCYPGGSKGYMAALDRHTGATVWANTEIGDPAGNASSILVETGGARQVVTMTRVSVVGVDAGTGDLLWRHERDNGRDVNCETPIRHGNAVHMSSGYGIGAERLSLTVVDGRPSFRRDWRNPEGDNLHGGPILHEGYLYGIGHTSRQWFCIDADTGATVYRDKTIRRGALTYADGLLYCLGTDGTMWLVQPSPDVFRPVSRFSVPRPERGFLFAHPVVCGGRLYIRAGDRLCAYGLRTD